jgi:hypothetical protein
MSSPRHIGELLPGIAADLMKGKTRAKKPAAAAAGFTRAQEKDIQARIDYGQQEYGTEKLAYMPSQLVQCSFPHDDPGDVPAWSRSTPWLTVTFQPGFRTDRKTRQPVSIGYPFGTIPRLLMFYVMTEIQRKKNRAELSEEERRTVYLGASLGEFMRTIGLNPDNGSGKRSDRKRLREQVERFMRIRINFDAPNDSAEGYDFDDMLISEDGRFWWTSNDAEQGGLFESHIILSRKFYDRVLKNMVPLDIAALRALKNSALHLDLYAWFLYRGHTLRKGKASPQRIEWRSFMMQSGASYTRVRKFREKVIEALSVVRPYLKQLRIDTDEKGITVHPPRLAIVPPRRS